VTVHGNPRHPLFAPPAYSSVARTPKPGAQDHTCKSTSDLQIAQSQSPLHNTSYDSLSAPSRRIARTRLGHDETRTIVVAIDPKTNRIVEAHQVGRTLKSNANVLVACERTAFRDVRQSPQLRGAKRIFHNYQ
jgi:hypothetical protein